MASRQSENERVIDRLVVAYNAQDARAFADLFSPDAIHGDLHSETPQHGRDAIYERYVEVFSTYPENRTEVVHRVVVGPFVVDHEKVQRSKASEPFDVVAIYTLENGLVARVDFVRE